MGASRRVHALLLSNNFPLTAYSNFDTARVFFRRREFPTILRNS